MVAYERSIAPISGNYEKYEFLVDQYEWLKNSLEKLKASFADKPLPQPRRREPINSKNSSTSDDKNLNNSGEFQCMAFSTLSA